MLSAVLSTVVLGLVWALPSIAGSQELSVPQGASGEVGVGGTASSSDQPFVIEPGVRIEAVAPVEPRSTLKAVPRARPGVVAGPSQVAPPVAEPVGAAPAAGAPTGLEVPSLGVNVPVIGIGVTDGILQPPSDPQTLGWWSAGAAPGAAQGSALITGHTVSTGGGAFDNLETLDTGDAVRVRTARGLIEYAVTGVTIYRKASLAADAERVFSQSGPGRLVLITCEDWNGTGYDSNAIVFAERTA